MSSNHPTSQELIGIQARMALKRSSPQQGTRAAGGGDKLVIQDRVVLLVVNLKGHMGYAFRSTKLTGQTFLEAGGGERQRAEPFGKGAWVVVDLTSKILAYPPAL